MFRCDATDAAATCADVVVTNMALWCDDNDAPETNELHSELYFAGPSRTVSLEPSHFHSLLLSHFCYLTFAIVSHCVTITLSHCAAISLSRYLTVLLSHYLTASLPHCLAIHLTVSRYPSHCVSLSISLCLTASLCLTGSAAADCQELERALAQKKQDCDRCDLLPSV